MYKALRAQTTAGYETRTFMGKEYYVVPVVAMIEGVRFGAAQTSGELGLASEFGKFAAGWNTSPAVLSHPQVDGQFVSAGDPSILETYYLGEIFNTQVDDKKLRMEAWLDVDIRDRDEDTQRVFERVENGEIIEVSVGFFTEVEEAKGKFKGQSYTGIWRNVVPDHLAFLKEGEIGACSVADGCGSPRTNSKDSDMNKDDKNKTKGKAKAKAYTQTETDSSSSTGEAVDCACQGEKAQTEVVNNAECSCKTQNKQAVQILRTNSAAGTEETRLLRAQEIAALNHFITQAIPSDLLSTDIIRSLGEALKDKYEWPFIIGYTNEYVVFESYRENHGWELFRQNFSISSDGEVSFTSEPEEVRLITKIVGAGEVNVNSNPSKENPMSNKATKVQTETAETTAATDTATDANKPAEKAAETTETPAAATAETPATQASKPVTTEEYINSAPAEIREVLQSSLSLHNSRKNTLIANLKSTGRCKMTDAFLKAQSLESLENLAELAAVPSYDGAAAPIRSQAAGDDGAVPPAPKVFEKKTAA